MPFITRMKHKGSVPIETIFVSSDTDKEQVRWRLEILPPTNTPECCMSIATWLAYDT